MQEMLPILILAALGCWPSVFVANALNLAAPKETDNGFPFPIGWSPKPTPAPGEMQSPHELFKRQSMGANTCGWLEGIQTLPFTCVGSGYCAHNNLDSAVGCCTGDINTCVIAKTCLDSSVANGCLDAGTSTMCCIYSQYPYCVTYFWDSPNVGASMFQCYNSPAKILMETFYFTSSSAAASSSTPNPSTTTSSPSAAASSSSPSPTTSIHTSPTSSIISSSSPAPVPGQLSSSSALAPASSSSSTSSSSSPSSTNIGAIVGGAVGGVAALAIILLVIFLIIRHNRRQPPPQQPPPQMQSQINPNYPPYNPHAMQPVYQTTSPTFNERPYPANPDYSAAKPYPVPAKTEYPNYTQGGYQDPQLSPGVQKPVPNQAFPPADTQELPAYKQRASMTPSGTDNIHGHSAELADR